MMPKTPNLSSDSIGKQVIEQVEKAERRFNSYHGRDTILDLGEGRMRKKDYEIVAQRDLKVRYFEVCFALKCCAEPGADVGLWDEKQQIEQELLRLTGVEANIVL